MRAVYIDPPQVTDRTSLKMVPEQLKLLVRKLLVIISRVARLLEILVGVAFSFEKAVKIVNINFLFYASMHILNRSLILWSSAPH